MFFFSQIYVDPSLVLSLFSFPSFSKSSFVAHFLAFRMKIRLALSGKSSRCKEKLAVDFFTKV